MKVNPGFYTLVYGNGEHRTIRVKTIKDGALKGKIKIGYLTGSNNESSYTDFGFLSDEGQVQFWKKLNYDETKQARIRRAVQIIADRAADLGKAYAMDSGRCYRCNRLLTNPASLQTGIGPECATREGGR